MLEPYRVLDLTDERGQLTGLILAALGADVIAVEPPGGSPSRRLGPFVDDQADPENSLWHWAYNRGKRSVVIDLEDEGGRSDFLALVAGADAVVESFPPGYLAERRLAHDDLAAVNPRIVTVSISAFGQDGPKSRWAATDLIAEAAACELYLSGDPDRAPVRVSLPQAFHNAAADAACGALVALRERRLSGLGQHVDISAQEACAMITQGQILSAGYGDRLPLRRNGAGIRVGPLNIRWVYPAKDGHVTITLLFGPQGAFTGRLMDWVCEAGYCDEDMRATDWREYAGALLKGSIPVEHLEAVQDAITDFTSAHSKAELLEGALVRRVLMAPVSTAAELVASEQLAARNYWDEVHQPSLGRTLRYPGAFVQASDSPLKHLGPSPTVGEHTAEVLAEARSAASAPTSGTPTPGPASTDPIAPLAGLKVVDLTWYMAGPLTTRMLADWGATVVRVESVTRPDGGRGSGPALNGRHGPDSGGYSLTHNSGKLGLALNLTRPESRAVLEDLVRWADVAVVGYSPRAARNLRLDYGSLSAVNPRLIMLSTCLMGQTGPLAEFAGFGNLSAAIAGFYEIGGWADRPPIGPYLAYTDVVAPRFSFCSVLAALEHRERTGRGQLLDLSQAESTAHLLSPAVLDVQVNGRVAGRHGNDDDHAAPHGVYPATGEDRWVAIACPDDRSWQALAGAMGRADLANDPVLATLAGRIERRRELDEAVAAWTSSLTAAEVQDCLQALGVPAHELLDSAGCWADPQLQHRGHFQELSHPLHGTVRVQGPRLRFSRTATSVRRAAPPLGEDTFEVLHDLLNYDEDRIAELAAGEVLE